MPRWEYTTEAIGSGEGYEKRLNELGARGWELVASHLYSTDKYFCTFKKPKPRPGSAP